MELYQTDSIAKTAQPYPSAPSYRYSRRILMDTVARYGMGFIVLALVLLVPVVAVVLLLRTWPILSAYPLLDLLRGRVWQPMQGLFGFAPFIAGSVAVTGVAMVLAVIPAILSGIYMAEYTSTRARRVLKPLLDVLVGIPSVIFGLWGVLFVVPLIRDRVQPSVGGTLGAIFPFFSGGTPNGYGMLAAGFVLAIMVFPLIVAVTEEVMRSVPGEMRAAVVSLGATRWEATKVIVFRRCLPGIIAAVILGFSRAFGETLAVMMVVGNIPQIPHSLFDAAYPLPALIANNFGEMMSVPLYEAALMGAALLLLVIVFVFNLAARLVIIRLT